MKQPNFTIHLNSIKYQDYLKAYLAFYNLNNGNLNQGVTADTHVPVRVRNLFNTESTVQLLSRDQIARQKDVWRRYQNMAILSTGFIYMLSIIEANVAAHLKGFDISDDLSLQIVPEPGIHAVANVRIVFSYK